MGLWDNVDPTIKKGRKTINKKTRDAVRAVQGFRCANNHDHSLKRGGYLHHKNGNPNDNRITNLEYWCAECHKKKTAEQARKRAKMKAREKKLRLI